MYSISLDLYFIPNFAYCGVRSTFFRKGQYIGMTYCLTFAFAFRFFTEKFEAHADKHCGFRCKLLIANSIAILNFEYLITYVLIGS